jgi:peptidyl-prolyl cis-trans isomerase SurA
VNRNRTGRRLLALAPAAALAVLALTACDPLQAGSAAVVSKTRVTESQVDADAKSVIAQLTKDGAQVPSTDQLLKAQVQFRVDARLVEIAAQRQGIVITQGQIDDLIATSGGRAALEKQLAAQQSLWLPPGQLDALAREFLTQQRLGPRLAPGKTTDEQTQAVNDYITNLASEVGVAVSPRYGSFDPKTLQVGAPLDDLSVPAGGSTVAPSASPTPTG